MERFDLKKLSDTPHIPDKQTNIPWSIVSAKCFLKINTYLHHIFYIQTNVIKLVASTRYPYCRRYPYCEWLTIVWMFKKILTSLKIIFLKCLTYVVIYIWDEASLFLYFSYLLSNTYAVFISIFLYIMQLSLLPLSPSVHYQTKMKIEL